MYSSLNVRVTIRTTRNSNTKYTTNIRYFYQLKGFIYYFLTILLSSGYVFGTVTPLLLQLSTFISCYSLLFLIMVGFLMVGRFFPCLDLGFSFS